MAKTVSAFGRIILACQRRRPLLHLRLPPLCARVPVAAGAQEKARTPDIRLSMNVPLRIDGTLLLRQARREYLIYYRRGQRPPVDPADCAHPEKAVFGGRCIFCGTKGLGRQGES